MDFQNRVGSKPGTAGIASLSETNAERRERLRRLALEVIDLDTDPYLMKNHLGSYECRLCLTLHLNEGSYLSHTQGKKHQSQLARRAARESAKEEAQIEKAMGGPVGGLFSISAGSSAVKKAQPKIGRPGYKVSKECHFKEDNTLGLLFQLQYPLATTMPTYRLMSAFEQSVDPIESGYDKGSYPWQYIVFAAIPYENVAFKIPSNEIDTKKIGTLWDPDLKLFTLQLRYKKFIE